MDELSPSDFRMMRRDHVEKWRLAACTQIDVAEWDYIVAVDPGRAKKSFCERCPLRQDCRDEADSFEIGKPIATWLGVWGNETVKERVMRRGMTLVGANKYCSNGHLRTVANTKIEERGGQLTRVCLNCSGEWPADENFCRNGHEYTSENTRIDPAGYRKCRQCQRDRTKKYEDKRRAQFRKFRKGK